MSGGGNDQAEKEEKRRQRRVAGGRLDAVALGLAAATGIALIVVGALALANERISNSLSGDPLPLYVAAILASVVVLCSLLALACLPGKRGNGGEVALLFVGGASFVFALVFMFASLADSPSGSGRPTISSITVDGAHPTLLSFTIRADRLQTDGQVSVVVRSSMQAASSQPVNQIYAGVLRPDGEGAVEQKISLQFVAGPARYVSIFASARSAECPDECTADLAREGVCSTIQLPPDP